MAWTVAVLIIAFFSGITFFCWVGWRFFLPRTEFSNLQGVAQQQGAAVSLPPPQAGKLRKCGAAAAMLAKGREARFLVVAVIIATGVVSGVVAASGWVVPDPLTATRMDRQDHIQLALNPERLVPPPVLPPSIFIGQDRPALETADRDWSKLDRRFMQNVLQVFLRLQERGYDFALLEGYRSPDRQDKLAAMGGHVTNARAFQSRHQYGLAVDIAPMRDGQLVISERDPWAMKAYEALGEEAERLGLVWGGRWSLKDYGHIEAKVDLATVKAN